MDECSKQEILYIRMEMTKLLSQISRRYFKRMDQQIDDDVIVFKCNNLSQRIFLNETVVPVYIAYTEREENSTRHSGVSGKTDHNQERFLHLSSNYQFISIL